MISLCEPISNSVKENFSIDNSKDESYVIVDYSESLFLIEGMLPVKKQDAQDKLARKKVTRFDDQFIIIIRLCDYIYIYLLAMCRFSAPTFRCCHCFRSFLISCARVRVIQALEGLSTLILMC